MTNKNQEAFEQMQRLTKQAKKFYGSNYNPGSLYPPRDTKFFLNEDYIPFDFETDYDDPLYTEYRRVRMLQDPLNDVNETITKPKNFGDYMAENMADMAYGADKALSGATFGGYDWLKRKTGIGVNETDYLNMKGYNTGTDKFAKTGGTISEIGGNVIGGGRGLVNGLQKAGLKGFPLATATGTIGGGLYGLTSSNNLNEIPYNTTIGAVSGGALGGLADVGINRLSKPLMKRIFNVPQNTTKQNTYNTFIKNNASDEMLDFTPRDSILNSRLFNNIEADNTPITMTPINTVANFNKTSELRKWLKNRFSNIKNQDVYSTGENVNFSNSAADRIIKNSRNPINNIAYSNLEDIVANAHYSGMRPSDLRHINSTKGQNVYHSGIIYNGEPYSVEFYVDQPLLQYPNGLHNYAGQHIKKIQQVARDTDLGDVITGSIAKQLADGYNLANLRGKVNPNIKNISSIYEGLNGYQAGSLDAAIEIGASRSSQKVGSLDHITKVIEAIDDMQQSPNISINNIHELTVIKNRMENVLQNKLQEVLRPYNRYENFYKNINDNLPYLYPSLGNFDYYN